MSKSNSRRILAALVLAALVALPAIAEEASASRVAAMNASPGSISWNPLVSFDKLVLTVQGDDYTSTQEFTGGRPHFAPVDDEGYLLPDGTYSWELTVIPRALDANNNNYRSAEPSADGRSLKAGIAPEGLVQSGSFTIANGAIVDPGLIEPESNGARPATRAAEAADIDDSDAANQ
jgi:hypothetical protein